MQRQPLPSLFCSFLGGERERGASAEWGFEKRGKLMEAVYLRFELVNERVSLLENVNHRK